MLQTIDGIKFLQSSKLLDRVCQKFNSLNAAYPANAYRYCEKLFSGYLETCSSSNDPLKLQLTNSLVTIGFSQESFSEQYASDLLAITGPLEDLKDAEKLEIFQKHSESVSKKSYAKVVINI